VNLVPRLAPELPRVGQLDDLAPDAAGLGRELQSVQGDGVDGHRDLFPVEVREELVPGFDGGWWDRLVGPDLVDVRADSKPLLRRHRTTSLASSSSASRSYRAENSAAFPARPPGCRDLSGARLSVCTVLSHQRSVLGSVAS